MNSPVNNQAQPVSNDWQMYRTLVGVGLICALIIVSVFEITLPIITENKIRALEKAIFAVLPEAKTTASFIYKENRFIKVPTENTNANVHAGFDKNNRLTGFAIEAHGMGYQDNIFVLYGYDPMAQAIIGLEILQSRETPGLGSKIGDDPPFLENFVSLDVTLTANNQTLVNEIEAVKKGRKSKPWQVDSITGATISSVAIAKILNNSARQWLPLLKSQPEELDFGH